MKPTRIRMCHSLVMNYGLYKKMEIFVSDPNLHSWPTFIAEEMTNSEQSRQRNARCPSSIPMNTSISCTESLPTTHISLQRSRSNARFCAS